MKMKVYIDGKYYEKDEAKISVYDHGLLYGDGVFEGIRVYAGKVFKLEAHIGRLYRSAQAIALNIPIKEAETAAVVLKTVELNGIHEGYIRLLVTRGRGDLGVDPRKCPVPSVIVIVDDISLYPREFYAKGISVITASTRRMPADCLDPRIKSLNYLNNILAKIEASRAGALEAIMLSREGYVTECTGDNIFIINNKTIITPLSHSGILEGITRETVIELSGALHLPFRASTLTRYDLYNAEECFLTGTGAEIIPVISIDGRTIGTGSPGPVTRRLIEAFRQRVTSI
ncbi:MAG: branched-chain-amino-acid transaminase [Spirochaetales bacterium]|nr:branched-chain-amino-acid transaminase [Spirochaetales bacterium]